jgi:hypothetical protein
LPPAVAALLLIAALWPPTLSLYGLTGEESVPAQLRGLVHWLYGAIRPQPDLAPAVEISHAGPSPFGVNTFLEQEVLAEVRKRSLALIREAGFAVIRQQFPWEDIEIHGKGDFVDRRNDPAGVDAWVKYDNIVDLAGEHGLEIIARLDDPPAWTRVLTDTVGSHAPPDRLEDYGDFVANVVGRYRGRITYFQLWNEPNIYPEWGEQAVNPEAFTELLCLGYRRAKAANPEAVILAPALSPTVALDGRDLNDLVFLQRMYDAGAANCFDVFSAQGYGLNSGPTDQRLRPTVINYPHNLLQRDVMVHNGDAEKPIWISEMAWNVAPQEMFNPYGRVSEEQQARYAVEAYQRAQEEWPWVGVVNYWYFKRATDQERSQAMYYFRLLEPDFTPLPAFTALSDYMNGAEAQQADQRPSFYYTWQRLRPPLALLSGGLLFFWLLRSLSPKPEDSADDDRRSTTASR